ncbi:threonine-phosphate decarboxylase CobD [Mesorhizobium sp. Z1-4]|uniref:threonine-phosphate decarboxylase CobD n=1 Tax=Mesorhizobium sp. Z1-4 TaxID=2448478 RepID=UPI000FDBD834|nr:threonine-phosphate decarboxylase CobD [Mesorhizobium sp. Z1-4]
MPSVEREIAEAAVHGGNIAAARKRFPDAPEPWIDLSTGISPFPYPHSPIAATAFERLPEPEDEATLRLAAARAYGAGSADNLVAAPGTQILLPHLFRLRPPGKAAVLGLTYAEHARCAAMCGHECVEVDDSAALAAADIAVVVNPNNPDGRVLGRAELLAIAGELKARGGLLIVDEAFMEVGPEATSLGCTVDELPVVVLRSFGKFHGLAGVRLGFAIAGVQAAGKLRRELGPWAVSGPAIAVGMQALTDDDWRNAQRVRLAEDMVRLREMLCGTGAQLVGGTSLFQLISHPQAPVLFETLGRHGILVRPFDRDQQLLRFGLPDNEVSWSRLEEALSVFRGSPER